MFPPAAVPPVWGTMIGSVNCFPYKWKGNLAMILSGTLLGGSLSYGLPSQSFCLCMVVVEFSRILQNIQPWVINIRLSSMCY